MLSFPLLPFLLFMVLCCNQALWGQFSDPDPRRIQKEKARQAVLDMRDSGLLIVRLKTEHRAIQVLEAVVARKDLRPKQLARHQAILDGRKRHRDEINQAFFDCFADSFNFCPVYFVYDTAARRLSQGDTAGILWVWSGGSLQPLQEPLKADRKNWFTVYYREASGDYPYDALAMARVTETLYPPFPDDAPVRSSFVNETKRPQMIRAARSLESRLFKFYREVKAGGG